MKRKNVLFILIIFTLLTSSCRTAIQKVSADELTDEHILLLMEAEGYDISSPHFSCIYNERVIYGPNYTENELLTPETPVSETETASQSVELPSEDTCLAAEKSTEEPFPSDPKEEIVFNEPYSIPENSFVSESIENEDELDILAQWEAFLKEETYTEEKTEGVTELSTELTELTQITEIITEETMTELLDTNPVTPKTLAKKPQLPKHKPIMAYDSTPEKETVIEPVALEKPNNSLILLCFVACGAGLIYLRSKYAQKNN